MSETPYYCAQASLTAGEMCFGTAVNADIWLLVEVPEPWGKSAVKESSMPLAVKNHLAGLTRTSKRIRTQLIKEESRTHWPRRVFIAFARQHDAYMVGTQIDSYDQLLRLNADDLLERHVALDNHPIDTPVHLVCTHGRHDKCCAKFGFATYKLMHNISPGSLWQTSHVGGDRFASNVISFPTGVYYGHVDDDSARAIIDAEARKEIYLERYRGRTCFGTHGQVAEYFVRRESGIREVEALSREWVMPNADRTEWTGFFMSNNRRTEHIVRFAQGKASFRTLLTCHAAEEKSPLEYKLLEYSEHASLESNSTLTFAEIKTRWEVRARTPFPNVKSNSVAGLDLLSLDYSVAGCIDTFVHNKGKLDDDRIRYLRRGCHELKRAVRELEGAPQLYFRELLLLTRGVVVQTTGGGC